MAGSWIDFAVVEWHCCGEIRCICFSANISALVAQLSRAKRKEFEISIKLFTAKGVISHKNMAFVPSKPRRQARRTATGYNHFRLGTRNSTTFKELSPANQSFIDCSVEDVSRRKLVFSLKPSRSILNEISAEKSSCTVWGINRRFIIVSQTEGEARRRRRSPWELRDESQKISSDSQLFLMHHPHVTTKHDKQSRITAGGPSQKNFKRSSNARFVETKIKIFHQKNAFAIDHASVFLKSKCWQFGYQTKPEA